MSVACETHLEWMDDGEVSVQTDADQHQGGQVKAKRSQKLEELARHVACHPLGRDPPPDLQGAITGGWREMNISVTPQCSGRVGQCRLS